MTIQLTNFISETCHLIATDASAPMQTNNLYQTLMLLGFGILFFYFLLWRPEQKRRKALEQQRSALKIGDRVTVMGILGTVNFIQDTTVILKMVDGSKIEVLKMAISDVQAPSQVLSETPPVS